MMLSFKYSVRTAKQRRSPRYAASAAEGSSVGACWPPLTPEHGFPSLSREAPPPLRPGPRALPLGPLPETLRDAHIPAPHAPLCKGSSRTVPPRGGGGATQKTADTPLGHPHIGNSGLVLPTVALPTSGVRVEATLPLSRQAAPLSFSAPLWHVWKHLSSPPGFRIRRRVWRK